MNGKIEKCCRCEEKGEIEFMFSIPAGYMCENCASDMGVKSSIDV